ncbi:MAG: M23 family metallopeptidase [Ruminococcaceae bacterium]|nr:M23 family metallopeptidase [Oscillospiraceae bacterium]
MSNLLNGIAAAVSAKVRRDADKPSGLLWKCMNWLYRNICWYGMQIIRSFNRARRRTRRVLRPVKDFLSRRVGQPLSAAWASFKAFAADCGRGAGAVAASRKDGGIKAMARTAADVTAKGTAKHRSFLIGAVNHCLPVLSLIILAVVAVSFFGRTYVLGVDYNGSTIGYVAQEGTYTDATEMVGQRVISSSEDFRNALRPSYTLCAVSDLTSLSTAEELCNTILVNSDDVEEACGLFVGDRLIGAVRSEGDLTYILDNFLEQYRMGKANESLTLVGEPRVQSGLYATEKIMNAADFREYISQTELVTEVYTIKKNDTVSKILDRFSMTEERFYQLNEGFDGNLVAGSTLLVEKESPVLQVQSVVLNTYEKTIAYSTTTVKDPTKYTSYRKVTTAGKNGTQKVTEKIVYIDGEQVSKSVVSQETLVEPVTEVITVGTKKQATGNYDGPLNVTGSGQFTWPVPGCRSVSSRYGYRWGRLHAGIDISGGGVYGKSIVAADKGTVISVKNEPRGYGLNLVISHNNGYTTRYAHCSKILVSVGETVSKGQTIAKVGNTGRSTGPHLHFEIRKNGSPQNPMNWF